MTERELKIAESVIDKNLADKNAIIKMITKASSKDPVPQPRLAKVRVCSTSPALVLKNQTDVIALWSINSSKIVRIGKLKADDYKDFRVGSWATVGLYPDGNFASISPKPLLVKVLPTRVVNGHIMVYATVTEAQVSSMKIREFGKIGYKPEISHKLNKKVKDSRDGLGVWIQWLDDFEKSQCKNKEDEYEWELLDNSNDTHPEKNDISEHEYRECMEYLRKRSQKVKTENNFSDKCYMRHYGLITEVNIDKKQLNVWSPGFAEEFDHFATIPPETPITPKVLLPDVGHWINFDTRYSDLEACIENRGSMRLSIREFMPVQSPEGISVFQIGGLLRVVISGTHIFHTDHKLVYEIPDFGYVVDREGSMKNYRSASFMQLILERTPVKIRKIYGIGWKVVASEFAEIEKVDVNAQIPMKLVPKHLAFELCTVLINERSFSLRHNMSYGHVISNQGKYQQIEMRRDYHGGHENNAVGGHYQNGGGYAKKRNNTNMDVQAMVERYDPQRGTGIFWSFEKGYNVHFVFTEKFDIDIGAYVFASLQQKPDLNTKVGYRWHMIRCMKLPLFYHYFIVNRRVAVNEQATFHGQHDRLGRAILKGMIFANIVDEEKLLQNTNISGPMTFHVAVLRRKVANAGSNGDARPAIPPEVFHWTICHVFAASQIMIPQQVQVPIQQMPASLMSSGATSSETIKSLMSDEQLVAKPRILSARNTEE